MTEEELVKELYWDIRSYNAGSMELGELLMKAYELGYEEGEDSEG